jgi:hypothetical protein
MTNGSVPAGWYRDPTGQGEARYWNGSSWTETVSRGGLPLNVPVDPTLSTQAPAPGTQMAPPMPRPQPTTVVEQSSHSSPIGTIVGVVIALFAFVVILAFIGNATSDDTPTPGSVSVPAEQPAEEAPAEGG